ncbi:hypothetical protein [Cupriavidus pauculus]|uniref:hypothetical protein n=1 Tax=Cupriavidus pauculus TaxID=82633 RepID=UPI001D0CD319|nr:hypothetical protein [Cupriavidus pauculus]
MKKYETWGWVAVCAAAIVLLAAGSHVVVLFFGLDSGQNQALAAWVQAVGSVLAIGIAIYIPWRQRADDALEERRRYFRDRADALQLLMLLADEVEAYVSAVQKGAAPMPDSHLVVHFFSQEAHSLMQRLTAFQDRTRLEVCASLAYELRKSIAALLALRTSDDSALLSPGPQDGDPLGIHKAISAVRRIVVNIGDTRRRAIEGIHTASND